MPLEGKTFNLDEIVKSYMTSGWKIDRVGCLFDSTFPFHKIEPTFLVFRQVRFKDLKKLNFPNQFHHVYLTSSCLVYLRTSVSHFESHFMVSSPYETSFN